MPGLSDLLRIYAAKETVWGTKVTPATVAVMGIKDLKLVPVVDGEVLKDMRGAFLPGAMAVIKKIGMTGALNRYATYEDAPYVLDALCGLATPVFTSVYTYSYAAPGTGTIPNARIQTLYQATNDVNSLQAYYAAPGFTLKKWTLKAATNEPIEFNEDYIGKQVLPAVVGDIGSLSDRVVTPLMGNDHALFIDAWGGTIGTTTITPDAYELEISIETGRDLVYALGSALPYTWKDARWKGSMKLVMEFNTATKAYYDAILAATTNFQKQIRNKFTNLTQSLAVDFAGTNVKAPALFTNKNGVLTVELEMDGTYNPTMGNWFKAVAVNTITAMA